MLVEDDSEIRETLTYLLESEKFTVIPAADGAIALSLLCDPSHPLPSLVILDYHMPVLNGPGFIEALLCKRDRDLTSIPIILLSAANEPALGNLKSRLSAILPKPIDIDVLLAQIDQSIRR